MQPVVSRHFFFFVKSLVSAYTRTYETQALNDAEGAEREGGERGGVDGTLRQWVGGLLFFSIYRSLP
jgi:hypothetical protein